MTNKPVTGPALVYVKRPFRRPANLFVGGFLPWPEDALTEYGNVPTFGFAGTRSASGVRKVRRATQLWNEKAGEQVFKVTPDRSEADVVVKGPVKSYNDRSWGEMPDEGKELVGITPDAITDASTIAHELGHTQGLKHLNMNPRPGVMRYGLEGGGAHRRQPTAAEGQKVVHHQNKGTAGDSSTATSNAAQFNKAAAKQKKPKKPAHERKVTGGHKVMQ